MADQTAEAVVLQKWPLFETGTERKADNYVATITLNRPAEANAFNGAMMDSLKEHFDQVALDAKCRLLVLQGAGKHFSAGADLEWMRDATRMTEEQNRKDAQKLLDMYEALYHLPMPTVALVHGAAYGGAVGLVACCDVALAKAGSRFCLSEVKMGLIPAIISPYLARKMPLGYLTDYALNGQIFDAAAAERCGLIQKVIPSEGWESLLRAEVNALLATAPGAQRAFKSLQRQLQATGFAQGDTTVHAIAKARVSKEAQAALGAFLDKKDSPWGEHLSPDFAISF